MKDFFLKQNQLNLNDFGKKHNKFGGFYDSFCRFCNKSKNQSWKILKITKEATF